MHDVEIDIAGCPGQDFVPGARLSSSGDYEFIYETVEQPVTVLRPGRNIKRFVPGMALVVPIEPTRANAFNSDDQLGVLAWTMICCLHFRQPSDG